MKPPNFWGYFFNSAQLLVEIYGDIEWTIKVLQHRMLRIFLRKIGMFCWDFPIYTESIVEDADAAICLWVIEVITLVLEIRLFLKGRRNHEQSPLE